MLTWFNNLKIGSKIRLGFLIVGLILIAIIFFNLNELNRIQQINQKVIGLRVPTALTSNQALRDLQSLLANLRGRMLLNDELVKTDTKKAWKNIETSLESLKTLSENGTDRKDAERLQVIQQRWADVRQQLGEFQDLTEDPAFTTRGSESWNQAARVLNTKLEPDLLAIQDLLKAMNRRQAGLLESDLAVSKKIVKDAYLWVWLLFFAGLAISFFTAASVTRAITQPLEKIKAFSEDIASGDLKQEDLKISSKDEMGALAGYLNEMVLSLRRLIESSKMKEGETTAIIQSVVDPLIVIDESGAIESFNAAAEEVFGYSTFEAIGQNVPVLLAESSRAEHADHIQKCLQVGQAQTTWKSRELEGRRKDGSTFPIELSVRRVVGDDQNKIVGIYRDITERKQAEEALQQSKEETERQSWVKTRVSELYEAMQQEQDLVSLARATIQYLVHHLGVQIGAIYLVEDGALSLNASYAYSKRKNLSNKFEMGEGLVGQAALERKTIMIHNVPEDYIRIQSGLGEAVPRNIVVTPLVSEDTLVGVVELASLDTIEDDRLEFLNQAATAMAVKFNLTVAQDQMKALLEETQNQAEELRNQQEELHQQQEELRQSNRYLEEQAKTLQEQRNNIENQHQLIQIKAQELEEASQYKSEFLANMSHELRTPLNSILILSQLLERNKDGNLTEKQEEFAKTIRTSGEDLLNLINDILDLSKVEAGKMDLDVQNIDVRQWANSMHQKFAPVADEKGVPMHVQVEENVPDFIYSDPKRLDQICKNLLSNAFKFTEQGSVTLAIKRPGAETGFTRSDLDPASTLAVSISDTGKGISPEKQHSIFEAFQQEDGATNRKFGGTGLGLSICKEMVKLLGGEIHLESELGKGSTFTFYIPVEAAGKAAEQEAPDAAIQEGKISVTPSLTPKESVKAPASNKAAASLLIVEDDEKFGEVLTNTAQSHGYNAIAVQTAEAGLRLAYSHRPTGIILDLGLPGMDGMELMNKLRSNPYTQDIPVYVISGLGREQQALQSGAVGYLEKPVDTDQLQKALGELENTPGSVTKTVLFIEDDATMRDHVSEVIGQIGGVETLGAANVEEALQILQKQRIDCLVVDLVLGGESGEDLLEQIKDHEFLKYIPVIIYTGRDLSPQQEALLRQYSQKIIIKGVESAERLLTEVRFHLFGLKKNLLVIGKENETESSIEEGLDLVGKKLLLVDDDMRNVFALTNILEEKGITVVTGKNGREGLEKLEAEPDIDLVLMDIMMPEMDGYEAIKKIRKDLQKSTLPIIALTAKAMKGDRQKCLDAGANEYLTKPINNIDLLEKINSFLIGG